MTSADHCWLQADNVDDVKAVEEELRRNIPAGVKVAFFYVGDDEPGYRIWCKLEGEVRSIDAARAMLHLKLLGFNEMLNS